MHVQSVFRVRSYIGVEIQDYRRLNILPVSTYCYRDLLSLYTGQGESIGLLYATIIYYSIVTSLPDAVQ